MLIHEPSVFIQDPVLSLIAKINGLPEEVIELQEGIYQVGHFGSSNFLEGYNQYPYLPIGAYGVCDNVDQLLEKCPELTAPGRNFIVAITPVHRDKQPSSGGWRWHKWGEYIGTQNPQTEYLYDEEHIDLVYVYHIYEKT